MMFVEILWLVTLYDLLVVWETPFTRGADGSQSSVCHMSG